MPGSLGYAVERMSILETDYKTLTAAAGRDLKGPEVARALRVLIEKGIKFLAESCDTVKLRTQVPNKVYVCFSAKGKPDKTTRPVNAKLLDLNLTGDEIEDLCTAKLARRPLPRRAQILYTGAMSYCCTTDLLKKDDKKTPGTFFECFVGHLVAATFGVNPTNSIEVLNLDLRANLPTDFIFHLGDGKNKIHLPVKTSTRERVVQVWAHQRVLDGVFGVNRFKGVLTAIAETNMVRRDMSVVEVCLPDQWTLYQMFIAQMHRVYYLDPPVKYLSLGETYPYIRVKSFSAFFDEAETLANASPLA